MFDGTANQLAPDVAGTNVVRLYRAITEPRVPEQVVFYDPGVGTFGSSRRRTGIGRNGSLLIDRAFGRGVKANVADGYRYLMRHYQPGDRIYLLGFSRGAYTARALAALLHGFGLLEAERENLVDYALQYFWRGSNRNQTYFEIAGRFKAYFSQSVDIEFMGLFDTVSAIGWARRRFSLPWTDALDNVHNGWHAVAIDERRGAYEPDFWASRAPTEGDFREVWFAGVHSDIGGTFSDHRLADITLNWMAAGAAIHGLTVNRDRIPDLSPELSQGTVHSNLFPFWWLAGFGRRSIPNGAGVHRTVRTKVGSEYAPPPLDTEAVEWCDTPPWPVPPDR
jgi:uncharacterized protein (DUF2235 family)